MGGTDVRHCRRGRMLTTLIVRGSRQRRIARKADIRPEDGQLPQDRIRDTPNVLSYCVLQRPDDVPFSLPLSSLR